MTHNVSFCPRLMLKVRSHRPLRLPVRPLYTTMHSSMNLEPYHLWVTFMVGLFSNVYICCPRSSKSQIVPNVPGPTVSMVHLISWMSDLSRHFCVFQMPSYFRLFVPITVDFHMTPPGCYRCQWPTTVPTRIEQVYYYRTYPNFQWALLR